MWGRRGQLWQIHVYLLLEPDARALVRVKGEWLCENSRGFYCNGLEEGQYVVAIVYDGGQRLGGGRLGGGLLFLTWILCLGGGCLGGGLICLAQILCFTGFVRILAKL